MAGHQHQATNATSRAQWVVPQRAPGNQLGVASAGLRARITTPDSRQSGQPNQTQFNSPYQHPHKDQGQPAQTPGPQWFAGPLDKTICDTITLIVEQYLRELKEHQDQIDLARKKRASSIKDVNFIKLNDISRLVVRDRQTKAIETIKQLTSWLQELTTIENQKVLDDDTNTLNLMQKLSNLRCQIIHTLNDFVLANSDIDLPILDLDDPTNDASEYDLCTEAHRSTGDICGSMEISNDPQHDRPGGPHVNLANNKLAPTQFGQTKQAGHYSPTRRPLANRTNDNGAIGHVELSSPEALVNDYEQYKLKDIHDDYQLVEMNKRRREIQKLEKDTVELRNLFADFYLLVKGQGEHIDRIEDNLVVAAQQIGDVKLTRRDFRPGCGVLVNMIPITGCITGAIIGGPIGMMMGGKVAAATVICASTLIGYISSLGAQKCITNSDCMKAR